LRAGKETAAVRKTAAKETIRRECGRGNICWQNASAKSLTGRRTLFGQPHGLINYTDTKAKCRHQKNLTCKGTFAAGVYQSL
jgi:hypothetical protein